MKQSALKVGFDLDGVLLYNPVLIARPLIAFLKRKKIGIKRDTLEFYVPQTKEEKFIWELFHKTSLVRVPGVKNIATLKKKGLIEPYLITARFKHLEEDFSKCKKKMKAEQLFASCYMNSQDEQPHLFKEKMIKQLKLDVFIEDNWDVVQYLNKNLISKKYNSNNKTHVIWVSNILDYKTEYHFKVSNLKQALSLIENNFNLI